ncbi:MAG: hypothetical protein ACXW2A_07580 [Burkholderiales bacterium]
MAKAKEQAGKQEQKSRQSIEQGGQSGRAGGKPDKDTTRTGIGSTQSQGRQVRERPSAGTPDIEREHGTSGVERGAADTGESLVGDSTGAFKERP